MFCGVGPHIRHNHPHHRHNNMDAFPTPIKITCAHCQASPKFWDGYGSMVCDDHVDLSGTMLGKRPFEALYDAALICFDLAAEDVGEDVGKKECGLCCEEIGVGVEFGTCDQGHVACTECVSNYVEKTLMPVRTVWLDTVPCCVDADCSAFFKGHDVSACLSEETIAQLEKTQMDVSHLFAGDVDPSSKELLDKDTKGVPGVRNSYLKHWGV